MKTLFAYYYTHRLVGAIGAVAVVVVEARDVDLEVRIRDTSECLCVLVELRDYPELHISSALCRSHKRELQAGGGAQGPSLTYILDLHPAVEARLRHWQRRRGRVRQLGREVPFGTSW